MPAQSKIDMLDKISASLDSSKGMFVIDYRGLSVKEAQELRRGLRAASAEMKVYKNNLVKIALEKAGKPAIDDMLVGTTACVFYDGDPVEAAKIVKETSKKLNKVEFLGGITGDSVVSAADAMAIADLPSREELLAKLVGTLSNPLSGTVRALNGINQGLVTALEAVVDQKNAA
ncbi:MAG: 50S ribosomal protein L10 [Atopobiaceae bacterium]|jgi:large subunit ribosomal protein L10|nr:50S ribosomal protein L10 [Atopobiaceae bacterium]MCI2173913.1 50S ribosomal protein L10 [Atopobiaceae bacterium]MCI2207997.1 50S ribosomal protein L10 [Atopobiaceae bacterium]